MKIIRTTLIGNRSGCRQVHSEDPDIDKSGSKLSTISGFASVTVIKIKILKTTIKGPAVGNYIEELHY